MAAQVRGLEKLHWSRTETQELLSHHSLSIFPSGPFRAQGVSPSSPAREASVKWRPRLKAVIKGQFLLGSGVTAVTRAIDLNLHPGQSGKRCPGPQGEGSQAQTAGPGSLFGYGKKLVLKPGETAEQPTPHPCHRLAFKHPSHQSRLCWGLLGTALYGTHWAHSPCGTG